MTPATQAKVLRVLQEQRFERVGGNETIKTDVRVIAATNQNLASDGRRRTVPPGPVLPAQRVHDRPAAAARAAGRRARCWSTTSSRRQPELGKNVRGIDPAALAVLEAHPWPGNVRELQNAIRYAVVHAVGEVLTLDCLPASVRGQAIAAERRTAST